MPLSPVAAPTQAGLSSQQDTGPRCCKFIFFPASAASLQEKNHTAWPKVFISHLLSALSIFSCCLFSTLESKSCSEALGTGVSWIFWGMHHSINYKKRMTVSKKVTTFKFGKCFMFLILPCVFQNKLLKIFQMVQILQSWTLSWISFQFCSL